MASTENFTHISLCAGYGGIDLGLKNAIGNVCTVAFAEIEAYAVAGLIAKMEQGLMDSAPVWTDLKTFPYSEFRDRVDILSGGFPCQPFSAAGKRQADDDPRHLFPYIVKGIKDLNFPPLVFLENVEGIINSDLKGDGWADPAGTPVLLHILRELERLGYWAEAGVFSAAEVGASHQRKRVFILGVNRLLRHSGYACISKRIGERQSAVVSAMANPYDTRDFPQECGSQLGGEARSDQSGWDIPLVEFNRLRVAHPAGRGSAQFAYEPPRVVGRTSKGVGNDHSEGCVRCETEAGNLSDERRHPQIGSTASSSLGCGELCGVHEPSVGGASDGLAYWLDSAQLLKSYDSLEDEIRLLGNGVVPAVASIAFRTLFKRIEQSVCKIPANSNKPV